MLKLTVEPFIFPDNPIPYMWIVALSVDNIRLTATKHVAAAFSGKDETPEMIQRAEKRAMLDAEKLAKVFELKLVDQGKPPYRIRTWKNI